MRRIDFDGAVGFEDDLWAELTLANGEYAKYVLTRPKREMVRALLRVADFMPPAELGLLAADVWIRGARRAGPREDWQELFELLPPGALMTAAERAAFEALPDPIPVFRGWREGGAKGKGARGRAWTTSRELAEFFAGELPDLRAGLLGRPADGEPKLAIGRVAKADTVGLLARWGEQEVITPDPSLVVIEGVEPIELERIGARL